MSRFNCRPHSGLFRIDKDVSKAGATQNPVLARRPAKNGSFGSTNCSTFVPNVSVDMDHQINTVRDSFSAKLSPRITFALDIVQDESRLQSYHMYRKVNRNSGSECCG